MDTPPNQINPTASSVPPAGDGPPQDISSVANMSMDTDGEHHPIYDAITIEHFQKMLHGVPGGDPASLKHVEHLRCSGWDLDSALPMDNTSPNLISLTKLEHLELWRSDIQLSSEEVESFSAFKSTLKHITVADCRISESTLISLINYFPNLKCLSLLSLTCVSSGERLPHPPLDPLEKLIIGEGGMATSGEFLDILENLSGMGLRVNEIAFELVGVTSWEVFAKRGTPAFGASVRHLKLPAIYQRTYHLRYSHHGGTFSYPFL